MSSYHDTIAGIPTGEPHFYDDQLRCWEDWEGDARTLDVGDTVGPIAGYLTYSVRISVKGPPDEVPARYVLVDDGKIAQTFSGAAYPTLPIFDTWANLKECIPDPSANLSQVSTKLAHEPQNHVTTPCCGKPMMSMTQLAGAVAYNPYNEVVQCHHCGATWTPVESAPRG